MNLLLTLGLAATAAVTPPQSAARPSIARASQQGRLPDQAPPASATGPGTGASAACTKPPLPAGGFDVLHDYNNFITYSDGYMSLGDLTLPDATPPDCGWPLVILIHGLPGSRINQRATADNIASRGYAVWAYEVRGQAQAVQLNPPNVGFSYYGPDEKFDLAEEVNFVRQMFPTEVSQNLVAVTGNSQGAIHTWFAAAFSAGTVTAPGRGTINFPRISACVAMNFNPDVHNHFLKETSVFGADFIDTVFEPADPFLVKDSAWVAKARLGFVNQAPLALSTTWNLETDRTWFSRLSSSDVPFLWSHSYLDQVSMPKTGLDAIASFPSATPTRVALSTNGHGSPTNFAEAEMNNRLRLRWFDRFLWGVQNGVEFESARGAALLPLDAATRNDESAVWQHRDDKFAEPKDLAPERYQLYGPGSMGEIIPAGTSSSVTIAHTVAPGFGPTAWAGGVPWSPQAVYANIPLVEHVYESPPLALERELAGQPRLTLAVLPDSNRFQISAAIEVEPPGMPPVTLSSWGTGVLGASVGIQNTVEFDMPPIMNVLPAGTIIRLKLRNIWITGSPMPELIKAVPYFNSYSLEILHGQAPAHSFLDLPFRKQVRLGVDVLATEVDFANPLPTTIRIEGGAARAGQPYRLLASTSGQVPGISLGNLTLPINQDPVTVFINSSITLGDPGLTNFSGVLDASGSATAVIDWTQMPFLLGSVKNQLVTFAAWTQVYGAPSAVSNPSSLLIE